jgi:peroxiredoxin
MKHLAVAIVVVICTLAGPSGGALGALRVGDSAREFTLDTLDGQTVRLSQSLGRRATLVAFWAAWSPRSVEALSDFQQMFAEHGQGGLQVIAVNVEHEEWDPAEAKNISAVIERTRATYPVVLDTDLSVFKAYGFQAVPSTALVDESGKVIEVLAGYPSTLRFDFRKKVLESLGVLSAEPKDKPEELTEYVPKGRSGTYYQMGKMLLKKGRRNKGLNLVRRAIAEDPHYLEANEFLAEALTTLGRFDEAERIRLQIAELTGQPRASDDAILAQDIATTTPPLDEVKR